jgi:hypothetical protein
VNTLCCLEEWRGEQRISPPGDNFTPSKGTKFTPGGQLRPWGKIHPWGTTSPLGSKFAHRGEVKNGPLETRQIFKLKTGIVVDVVVLYTGASDDATA